MNNKRVPRVPSNLPKGVYEFWLAFPRGSLPAHADLVWQLVNTAVRMRDARAQRSKFNIGIRGLRSQRNAPLKGFQAWLNSPQVLEKTKQSGLLWAHLKWWEAIGLILQGQGATPSGSNCKPRPAHAAFGGNKPGRPTSRRFLGSEIVAAYALLHGVSQWEAVESMIADWCLNTRQVADRINERDVRRILKDKSHFIHKLSENELRALAMV